MRLLLMLLGALTLSGVNVSAFTGMDTTSSISQARFTKPVKIGPEYFELPPVIKVDSALLRRLAIDERFRNRMNEGVMVKYYEDIKRLQTFMTELDIYLVNDNDRLELLEEAINTARASGDLKTQSLILNRFALYHAKKGNLEKSSDYLKESLLLRTQLADKAGIAKIIAGLAELTELTGKYEDAINYTLAQISAVPARLKDRHIQMAQLYVKLSKLKALQKNYAESEALIYKTALSMFKGNKPGRLSCFRLLTDTYYTQGRYSEAKWYCIQGREIAEDIHDTEALAITLVQMAAIKTRLGDVKLALADFKMAETIALQYNLLPMLISIKGDMGEIYRNMGDYAEAGSALDEYSRLRLSFLSLGKASY